MRVYISKSIDLPQQFLYSLPIGVEELDINGYNLVAYDWTLNEWRAPDTLSLQHLTCLHRLIIRSACVLKKCSVLHVPDSLRFIELFARNRDHNFYTDFPRIVPNTLSFRPPLAFIARYPESSLPTRRGWKKTIVHAPQVSVRNERVWWPDYVMCIEPQ